MMQAPELQGGLAEWIFGAAGILFALFGFMVPLIIAIMVVVRLGRIAEHTERTAAAVDRLATALRVQQPGGTSPPS